MAIIALAQYLRRRAESRRLDKQDVIHFGPDGLSSSFLNQKAKGGLFVRVNYAIVFVSDMKRSVSFYRDVVGLPLRFESPGWTEFATDGATLALHASGRSNTEKDDPQEVPAGRCRPGLSVPDIDEFHKRMVELKVPCLQEPKEVFGARIAQYADPDGLGLSVSEERRARAE